MSKNFTISGLLCLTALSLLMISCSPKAALPEYDYNPDTDWFHDAKVGAFLHFLPEAETFDLVDKFDVVALADQLEKAGVKVFELTLGQNSGYFIAPNPVYDEIAGYKAGERCAKRDLPMEMAKELKKRGIDFMLYLPCQTPNRDMQAIKNFGFDLKEPNLGVDRCFTEEGVANWSKVIAWWSKHYGDLVKGWWFDGGYAWIGFNWAVGREYNIAVKSGNPHSIVTFNPSPLKELDRHCHAADYTAGEVNDLLSIGTSGRWVDGAQAHVLTFLGERWSAYDGTYNTLRYTDEQIVGWVKEFTGNGGVVMFDVGPNLDESVAPIGTIGERQLHQLQLAVKAAGL